MAVAALRISRTALVCTSWRDALTGFKRYPRSHYPMMMSSLCFEQLHGTARGGDCDELRLLSDENTILNLRAHGGSLSLLGTKVL